jgi:Predicted membrane protein
MGTAPRNGGFMAHLTRDLETAQSADTPPVWDRIAESKEFKHLMATKRMFIVPAFIFFLVYYFALPVLVGYAPSFMSTKVSGPVNLAYLFALSQFVVAWIIAGLYVKAASDFDDLAKDILEKAEKDDGGK